jgi:hypothetical protein
MRHVGGHLFGAFVLAAATVALTAPPVRAEDKEVELLAKISSDESTDEAKALFPVEMYFASQKDWANFQKLWVKIPLKVDFDRHIVLVVATRFTNTKIAARLDEKGDLIVKGVPHPDARDKKPLTRGFSYEIGVISREGIKTINGKAIARGNDPGDSTSGAALKQLTERVEKLEAANAQLEKTVERLKKEIEQLKKN